MKKHILALALAFILAFASGSMFTNPILAAESWQKNALTDFYKDAVGKKAAALVDLNGDSVQEIIAVKTLKTLPTEETFYNDEVMRIGIFDASGNSEFYNNYFPYEIDDVYISNTNRLIIGVHGGDPSYAYLILEYISGKIYESRLSWGTPDGNTYYYSFEDVQITKSQYDTYCAIYGVNNAKKTLYNNHGGGIDDESTTILAMNATVDYSRYIGTWVEVSSFDETNRISITKVNNNKINFNFTLGEFVLNKSDVPIINNEVSIKYFIVPGPNFYDYEIKYDYADKWHQSCTLKILFGDNGISAVYSSVLYDGSFPSQQNYSYKKEGEAILVPQSKEIILASSEIDVFVNPTCEKGNPIKVEIRNPRRKEVYLYLRTSSGSIYEQLGNAGPFTDSNIVYEFQTSNPNYFAPDQTYYVLVGYPVDEGLSTSVNQPTIKPVKITQPVSESNAEIKVFLDGEQIIFDQPPINESGRVLVPIRAISEAMGATVDWDGVNQTATIKKDGLIIVMQVGNSIITKNGTRITLDVSIKNIGNRILVPVRALVEAFGAYVNWQSNENAVYITSKPEINAKIDYVKKMINDQWLIDVFEGFYETYSSDKNKEGGYKGRDFVLMKLLMADYTYQYSLSIGMAGGKALASLYSGNPWEAVYEGTKGLTLAPTQTTVGMGDKLYLCSMYYSLYYETIENAEQYFTVAAEFRKNPSLENAINCFEAYNAFDISHYKMDRMFDFIVKEYDKYFSVQMIISDFLVEVYNEKYIDLFDFALAAENLGLAILDSADITADSDLRSQKNIEYFYNIQ